MGPLRMPHASSATGHDLISDWARMYAPRNLASAVLAYLSRFAEKELQRCSKEDMRSFVPCLCGARTASNFNRIIGALNPDIVTPGAAHAEST